nr:AAA family ATPase [Halorientalis salina]
MTDDIDTDEVDRLQDRLGNARNQIRRRLVGQEAVLDQVLACLLADGNVLLESTPGLGKTLLVRTIAEVTDCSFSRVQNTPDLMPSDITGTEIIRDTREGREFTFQPGPIFANVVLADEINRATPKTQAALLEAMQERQVTAGGESRKLPDPFFVLATQNPVEQEGSLHPDETLYMNGRLWTASDALEYAKTNGTLVENGETKVYDVDATTQTLTSDGDMVETECLVYETAYEGEMYTFETKTGRRIRVSDNHPFLVNRDGFVRWVKAREIERGDALVSPAELSLPETPFPSHETALDRLEECGHDVVRAVQIRDLKNTLGAGETLTAADLDALRIAADYSKKELAARIDASYDQVCNFFQGAENGIEGQLESVLRRADVQPGDYVEDYARHRIDDELTDEEAGFFLGFIIAEGSVTDTHVTVTQKNLSAKLDRWIAIAERIGLDVEVRAEPTGREVQISSKPFVTYLDERYSLKTPERLLSAPEDFRRAFLEIFLLTESHFDADRRRISFSQKSRSLTNLVAHLLLDIGIIPWLYERDEQYVLRIQGEDIVTYLRHFEWRGEAPTVEGFDSAHRTIPLPDEKVERLVDILGMKHEGGFSDRVWYNSYYQLQTERNRMATPYFESLLDDVEQTLERRKATEIEHAIDDDLGQAAKLCGLSITDLVEGTSLTKHRLWQAYQSEDRPTEAIEYVADEYTSRVAEAEELTDYFGDLVSGDVFFDRVTSIESESYSGPVIGLSVPQTHNYIAGLGSCGINHNTYPLPEAQKDRFMAKVLVDYPDRDAEREIVDRFTGQVDDSIPVEKAISTEDLLLAQELVRQIPIAEDLRDRVVDLVRSTRDSDLLDYGASPRASMGLVVLAKARAFMIGRTHVASEDIEAMAKPVLRHRVVVDFRAERDGVTPDDAIEQLL